MIFGFKMADIVKFSVRWRKFSHIVSIWRPFLLRFKMADCFMSQFQAQMQLLNLGLISEAQEVSRIR